MANSKCTNCAHVCEKSFVYVYEIYVLDTYTWNEGLWKAIVFPMYNNVYSTQLKNDDNTVCVSQYWDQTKACGHILI